jgi:hypothetical protein
MQNAHEISLHHAQDHVLYNSAILFAVSLILCKVHENGKKLFTETVLALSLNFQHIGLNLQETKCTIRKSVKFWSRNNFKILNLIETCTVISAFEGHGKP